MKAGMKTSWVDQEFSMQLEKWPKKADRENQSRTNPCRLGLTHAAYGPMEKAERHSFFHFAISEDAG